jgi:predicted nucleic acid-binding protein
MKDRLLIDTNVLIDYLAVRQPFYAAARKLMVLAAIGEVELWLSASQVNDVFYVISEGGKQSLGALAQERLKRCREFIRICSLTEHDIDTALARELNDLEDACVLVCAEKVGADFIITRDDGFPTSRTTTLSAEGYFDFLRRKRNISYEELTLESNPAEQ